MIPVTSVHDLLKQAKAAEQDNDLPAAIETYEQILTIDSLSEDAYNRLMILYRKLKDKKKEAAIINKGIKAFEKHYKSKKSKSKKVSAVSEKLNKALGLTDKKGNTTYDPEPIATWKKRLDILSRKK